MQLTLKGASDFIFDLSTLGPGLGKKEYGRDMDD